MTPRRKAAVGSATLSSFSVDPFLAAAGCVRTVVKYQEGQVIYSQGDPATDVRYLKEGVVKKTVLSERGKEAVVAMLTEGDFFGEGLMAGQTVRMATTTAMTPCSVTVIDKHTMDRLLRDQPVFAARFLSHVFDRNARMEADLVDQLFNSSEKRLARTLLMLARYGEAHPTHTMPRVSQETLAEMVGTTRSRVNFFMNKFRKLGMIEYNGTLKVHGSELTKILRD